MQDEVFDEDMVSVFEGTEDEVLAWIFENFGLRDGNSFAAMNLSYWVRIGDSESCVALFMYLNSKTRNDHRDSRIKRYNAVLNLVVEAVDGKLSPSEATGKIIKLISEKAN